MRPMSYRYRPDVLVHLFRHGILPRATTPPELVRGYLNDLYRYELRKLRDRYMVGEFPKLEYHRRVIEIRDRYPVLALKPQQFLDHR
jgi:hypothetical protein